MGVSASGKTTVGRALAKELGCAFCDGDELHPAENIEKMRRGVPLDDADRVPWLRLVREHIDRARERGEGLVVACSALKEEYRRDLGLPDLSVALVYLRASLELVERRLRERKHHFMPLSLASSQFASLEEPRYGIIVDADQPPDAIVAQIMKEVASRSAK
jgi:gluconokinase